MFPFGSFIALPFLCIPIIHLEWIFVRGMKKGQGSFFPISYPMNPAPFGEKNISNLLYCNDTLVSGVHICGGLCLHAFFYLVGNKFKNPVCLHQWVNKA